MLQSSLVSISKGKSRRWVAFAATACVVVVGAGYTFWNSQSTQRAESQAAAVSPPKITTVTALGRLEPQGEVIKLSAPTSNNGNSTLR